MSATPPHPPAPRRRDQSGFTLIEAVTGMLLFAGLAVALAGLLTSALSATRVARERTVAQQSAMEQLETIRRMPYDQVGTVSGNPPGTIPPTRAVNVRGLNATLNVRVQYVADPTPTGYDRFTNYKRVTVTVVKDSDSKQLAREVTYVAPRSAAPYGGINLAVLKVAVVDYALNTPLENAAVALSTGPSAPRSDTTDSAGEVIFAGLTANPASGPQAYYDLLASLPGYELLSDAAAQHLQLAPGQTATPTLQLYRPATINVRLLDPLGGTFTGDALVTVTSGLTGTPHQFTVSGGTAAITTLGSDFVLPSVNYTVEALSATPLCASPVTQYVPDDYPNVLSTTFTLQLQTCPAQLSVTVKRSATGSNQTSATVLVQGGPANVDLVGNTGAGAVATFDLPSGDNYTVKAYKCSGTSSNKSRSVPAQTFADGPNSLVIVLNSSTCPIT